MKRGSGGLVFLALVFGGYGCESPSESPPLPPTHMWVTPRDGTTGLSALKVDIFASRGPGGVEAAERDAIAESVLATWPDLTPIPTTRMVAPAVPTYSASGVAAATADKFTLATVAPVGGGWYVALVRGVPPRSIWPTGTFYQSTAVEPLTARIRVGSAPALWGLDVCPKEGAIVVYVHFSEQVTAEATAAASLSLRAAGRPCARIPATVPSDFGYACADALLTELFEVSATDGLVSAMGTAVPPFERSITPDSLPVGSSGCPFYRDAI